MLFRVVDHYEDYSEYDPPEPNECLICLEINTHDNLAPIDLKTQQIYLKRCDCGGWVHLRCLCEWHEISNSCPICRLYMNKPVPMIAHASFYIAKFIGACILVCIRICFAFWFALVIAFTSHIYRSYFILNSHKETDSRAFITE
jgi:hypothetical protein